MTETLSSLAQQYALAARAFPLQLALYAVAATAFLLLFLVFVRGGQYARAFWCVTVFLAIDFLLSYGEDTSHHVYRIIGLAGQIRGGHLDSLLTNPATGEVFPVFVYYSIVPYVLPVLLTLAGCAPLLALKLAMALQIVVFAAGLRALVRTNPVVRDHASERVGYLLCMLLITATYIDGLWWTRAALGETWVYSLAPWVVYAIQGPARPGLLFGLLFVQVCGHPIVFLHSVAAEFVAAFGVSGLSLTALLRRTAVPLALALAVGSPYWLPQFLWIHDVLGNSAIPTRFADTFLYAADLINPLRPRNLGICLPLALLTVIMAARARTPTRAWVLVGCLLVLLSLQHAWLRDITSRLPVVDLSQFVWRLMFPTGFIAFAALIAAWSAVRAPTERIVTILALVAPFCLLLLHVMALPHDLLAGAKWRYDDTGYANYLQARNVWGVTPFAPNYSDLPQDCGAVAGGETHSVVYHQLRTGLRVEGGYVTVTGAPVGLVDYQVNGDTIRPRACQEALVFGPLPSGSTLSVSQRKLDYLLYVRLLTLLLGLATSLTLRPAAAFIRRRRAQAG